MDAGRDQPLRFRPIWIGLSGPDPGGPSDARMPCPCPANVAPKSPQNTYRARSETKARQHTKRLLPIAYCLLPIVLAPPGNGHRLPMMQGSPAGLLRFEFASGMSRIVVTSSTGALVSLFVPLLVPIYPRARPTARSARSLRYIHSADNSSYSPYYRLRSSPFPSVLSSAACRPLQTTTISRSLRTMPDPVQRTDSPYHDPAVKGPRSQQLSSGLSRSPLQNDKMIPSNKVNKTALHPSGLEPSREREHTELEEELHEKAHIDYDRVAIIPNPSVAALYEDALVYEMGSAIASSGALTAYSGAKTGRSPSDKRIVKESSSENDIWWGPVNKPMAPEVRKASTAPSNTFFLFAKILARSSSVGFLLAGVRPRHILTLTCPATPLGVCFASATVNLVMRHALRHDKLPFPQSLGSSVSIGGGRLGKISER
ncbi:hypothetical protein O1611_g8351 [Lasiodiplodia mahajangana]|uniref:Uncharacterized protein n=1 Tax=Lasiodiplodia mahajangana TaxID=1108764 RepID=A0ACC2JD40_9PEZI|nr:hypothetical protein O1611_g8351 [Lasiodiplodia mahajangana]